MNKPGHDNDCVCLSCNPSEPGQNAFQKLCGGCALPIREVEENVWVLHGSDECEAGGVHSPPPSSPPLAEFYAIRSRIGGSWWNTNMGWTLDPARADKFSPEERAHLNNSGSFPLDGEWVRFVEIPF